MCNNLCGPLRFFFADLCAMDFGFSVSLVKSISQRATEKYPQRAAKVSRSLR
jgi:hypothetical protein